MLKQRVLTALILLPLVMALIFALPAQWFPLLLAIILLRGSWEYRPLAGFSSRTSGYLLVALQAVVLAFLFSFRGLWNDSAMLLLSTSCAAWLIMFSRLSRYRSDVKPDSTYRLVSLITAIVSITTGWFALSWIRVQADGSWLILLLLLIVWAADTGAYFAGMTFGKNKLAPQISPKKTREGLLGGLFTAPLIALLAAHLMPITSVGTFNLIMVSLVTALVSVGGDLIISLHKRTSGVKDSGNLLPGHGGILDRLDSLLAAGSFFALGLLMSGYWAQI